MRPVRRTRTLCSLWSCCFLNEARRKGCQDRAVPGWNRPIATQASRAQRNPAL